MAGTAEATARRLLRAPKTRPSTPSRANFKITPPATITDEIRDSITEAFFSIAHERGWTIHAIAMTDSHFHAVTTAHVKGVEILRAIRDETPPFLVRRGLIEASPPFWSAGGYFSMIHTAAGLERACRYVERHLAPLSGETVIDDVSAAPLAVTTRWATVTHDVPHDARRIHFPPTR